MGVSGIGSLYRLRRLDFSEHVGVGGLMGVLTVEDEEDAENKDDVVDEIELDLCGRVGTEDLAIMVRGRNGDLGGLDEPCACGGTVFTLSGGCGDES